MQCTTQGIRSQETISSPIHIDLLFTPNGYLGKVDAASQCRIQWDTFPEDLKLLIGQTTNGEVFSASFPAGTHGDQPGNSIEALPESL